MADGGGADQVAAVGQAAGFLEQGGGRQCLALLGAGRSSAAAQGRPPGWLRAAPGWRDAPWARHGPARMGGSGAALQAALRRSFAVRRRPVRAWA
ncbi:hypothetical protein LP420_07420 [Massilia sp. B-10]|nr:hypothetical protein LP420_07420 [Massilia sp. B-10]